jgi:Golgi phosphoprotein 3 (GPP34)
MEPEGGEWPSARWRLTAPESYGLQAPPRLSGVEAFKLALRELVLRRALQVEQPETASPLRRGRPRSMLRLGTSVTEPALAPLLDLHARARRRGAHDGVLVEDLARAARREFGRSLGGYVNDHVYPSLARRGLLRSSEHKRWGVFPRTRHELTPAGEEAAAEVAEWLRVGRARVEGWTRESPERALAYAGGAGAAILLVPELYPDFERLGRDAATYAEPVPGGGEFDLGAFGSAGDSDAGDAFDAFDGIDAGAGWGGDGGGGAGGNGGG